MTLNTAEISAVPPQERQRADDSSESMSWYILKQPEGHCQIRVANAEIDLDQEHWGPYNSQSEAIAKRIGLIRSGKCQPV